ncbi:uncharacterized protein GGS22DRAFT_150574 [Annulohypoxylon maeteangense]|uniref:uncharacterized protein n=1 Tax=Annulohypoxylon maeteangense TaxID=1927788 RepID=UPI0020073129|nr:uncharacterized protein GGS22DRAFT_150574 [Annulohypoxylon maeteangense]KAI0890321.1 hypothetical protein GGS22DRAFT_150574 [Annulohypoxylon maeteangense]
MEQANRLKQRLQRDGMCDDCSIYCDGPVSGVSRRIAHYWCSEHNPNRVFQTHCKFQQPEGVHIHCKCCGEYHDIISFSREEATRNTRKCLGREGSVRLCEHVDITWSQIEEHLTKWNTHAPGQWKDCFDAFNIQCEHPSHDTRCMFEDIPTWPRACLKTSYYDRRRVVLSLEWAPHSDTDYFKIKNNQVPASQLRELFKKYRLGAARIFLPAYASNPIPEMSCFNSDKCNCVRYETGQQDTGSSPSNLETLQCIAGHRLRRNYGWGHNGQQVDQISHRPHGLNQPPCLITEYKRDIFICRVDGKHSAFGPTHEWFHAMDPDTYPPPENPRAIPPCKNELCMNYYRKPQTYRCLSSHH